MLKRLLLTSCCCPIFRLAWASHLPDSCLDSAASFILVELVVCVCPAARRSHSLVNHWLYIHIQLPSARIRKSRGLSASVGVKILCELLSPIQASTHIRTSVEFALTEMLRRARNIVAQLPSDFSKLCNIFSFTISIHCRRRGKTLAI